MIVDVAYSIELDTPHGKRTNELTLKTDGNSLSGSLSGDLGTQRFDGGTVTSGNVAWSVQINGPMGQVKLDFVGTVTGDEISGKVQMGSFGSSEFKGARIQERS